MSSFVEVAKVSELKDGAMKKVITQGQEILLAQAGGKYYAVSNRCPHMGGNLSQGKLEKTIVTCPLHHSQYDLSDGHVVQWVPGSNVVATMLRAIKSPRPLKTYNIKLENEKILVEV